MRALWTRLTARLSKVACSRWTPPVVWAVVSLPLLWAIARTFGLDAGYPGIPLIAYTPYVAVCSLGVVVLALVLRQWAAALLALAAAVLLLAAVVPRTVAVGAPSPGGPALTVASANLLVGSGEIAELVALVEADGVELLSAQELTPEAERAIDASALAELLPHSYVAARPGSVGIGLYSRFPLSDRSETEFASGQPGVRARVQVAGEGLIEAVAIHAPVPNSPKGASNLEDFLGSIPAASNSTAPTLLIGDFNATLDHSAMRDLLGRGYVDVADELGEGLTPTWPSGLWPPPVTIDHVLVDQRAAVLSYRTAPLSGSDHKMLVTEIQLPPGF